MSESSRSPATLDGYSDLDLEAARMLVDSCRSDPTDNGRSMVEMDRARLVESIAQLYSVHGFARSEIAQISPLVRVVRSWRYEPADTTQDDPGRLTRFWGRVFDEKGRFISHIGTAHAQAIFGYTTNAAPQEPAKATSGGGSTNAEVDETRRAEQELGPSAMSGRRDLRDDDVSPRSATSDTADAGTDPAGAAPASVPSAIGQNTAIEDEKPFGAALATAVLQSPEYRMLDDEARAECDELIERWKAWIKAGMK